MFLGGFFQFHETGKNNYFEKDPHITYNNTTMTGLHRNYLNFLCIC